MSPTDILWYANTLLEDEWIDDVGYLEKEECEEILAKLTELTGKSHMLIVHCNIELEDTYYDLALDDNDKNVVVYEEWDNR